MIIKILIENEKIEKCIDQKVQVDRLKGSRTMRVLSPSYTRTT